MASNKESYRGLWYDVPLVYDFKNKKRLIRDHINYMLCRTQQMFQYDGLPDTIPQRMLELQLQIHGYTGFVKYQGDLYTVVGGMGGQEDAYYMPTEYVVSNPVLRVNTNLKIGTDCVVMASDHLYSGLMPMFSRYASQLAENDITMRMVDINSRIQKLLAASDDDTERAARLYLQNVEAGELGVVAETALLDGLKSYDYSTGNGTGSVFTQLIEYQQYLKAGWYNDLGLNSNWNMKREAIGDNESQLNRDALLPLIDDMLQCRQEGLEAVNKMFGTNISVKLASSWALVQDEAKAESEPLPESGSKEMTPDEVTGEKDPRQAAPEAEPEKDKEEGDQDGSQKDG